MTTPHSVARIGIVGAGNRGIRCFGEPAHRRTEDAAMHGGADPLLVQNFVHGIHGRSEPSSSVRDGLRAVAIGQAAEIAWRERRSVEISELAGVKELE